MKKKILIVDDDEEICEEFSEILKGQHYLVETAFDGLKASAMIVKGEYDLVILDLKLPGLSGFVAEMTIFVGAFQHHELFYRIVTILAVSSIVITAVYILRVIGILLFGPINNNHYLHLKDADWYERLSTVTLVLAIAAIGLAPLWLSNMINFSLAPIVEKISGVINLAALF